MENLLKVSTQILHEIEENPTIQENWKTGMKVAVDYIIDEIYTQLFEFRKDQQSFEKRTSKTANIDFECETGYDPNDSVYKKHNALLMYFTSLNKK